jgi:hypothetical protein
MHPMDTCNVVVVVAVSDPVGWGTMDSFQQRQTETNQRNDTISIQLTKGLDPLSIIKIAESKKRHITRVGGGKVQSEYLHFDRQGGEEEVHCGIQCCIALYCMNV